MAVINLHEPLQNAGEVKMERLMRKCYKSHSHSYHSVRIYSARMLSPVALRCIILQVISRFLLLCPRLVWRGVDLLSKYITMKHAFMFLWAGTGGRR